MAHLVVELAVDSLTVPVHQLEGVGAIAVHVAVAVGDAAVAEEEGHLVGGLGSEGDEIPEHVGILGNQTPTELAVLCRVSTHGRLEFTKMEVGTYTERPFVRVTCVHMNHRITKIGGGRLQGDRCLLGTLL